MWPVDECGGGRGGGGRDSSPFGGFLSFETKQSHIF